MRLLVILFFLFSARIYGQTQPEEVLYYNCTKTLYFDSVDFKNLSFSVTGADTIITPPSIRIVPRDSIVKVIVYKKGKMYKTYNYTVIPIPTPIIELWVGERNKNSTGIYWVLGIKAYGNDKFKENFPKDARYRVDEYEIKLKRAGKIIEQRLVYNPYGDIIIVGLKKDDIISVEVKKVTRTNFRNEIEEIKEIKINTPIRTFTVDEELNIPDR